MANGDNSKVSEKQKSLSNAVQLIHMGNFVHQIGIFDLSVFPDNGNSLRSDDDLILGNKIALLAGDFLLANAQLKVTMMRCVLRASSPHKIVSEFCLFFLRDAEVLNIISSAMCDIIDYNFIGEQDARGQPLPFKPGQIPKFKNDHFESSLDPIKIEGKHGTVENEWLLRQILHRGYLIAKGCRATSVLAKNSPTEQRNCFELGKYLYLTWQAFVDLKTFKSGNFQSDEKLNLTSAPILFHLQFDPSMHSLISDQSKTKEGVDYQTIFNEVYNGPGLQKTEKMLTKLKQNAIKFLNNFKSSEEKNKIKIILNDFQ